MTNDERIVTPIWAARPEHRLEISFNQFMHASRNAGRAVAALSKALPYRCVCETEGKWACFFHSPDMT